MAPKVYALSLRSQLVCFSTASCDNGNWTIFQSTLYFEMYFISNITLTFWICFLKLCKEILLIGCIWSSFHRTIYHVTNVVDYVERLFLKLSISTISCNCAIYWYIQLTQCTRRELYYAVWINQHFCKIGGPGLIPGIYPNIFFVYFVNLKTKHGLISLKTHVLLCWHRTFSPIRFFILRRCPKTATSEPT